MDPNSTSNNPVPAAMPTSSAPATPPVSTAPESIPSSAPNVTVRNVAPDHNGPNKKIIIVAGIIIFAIIVIVVMSIARGGSNSAQNNAEGGSNSQQEIPIPEIDNSKPWTKFQASTTDPQINQDFTVAIQADSKEADIYGYDLLIKYDKAQFDIIDAKSAMESFQIFQHDRDTYFAITGIKRLNEQEATPFSGSNIIELTVRAKQAGPLYMQIMPEVGEETSKFVDKDVKVITPQFQPIRLEIK